MDIEFTVRDTGKSGDVSFGWSQSSASRDFVQIAIGDETASIRFCDLEALRALVSEARLRVTK